MGSSWHTDTLQLGNRVALLILNSGTLLPGILSCLALFLVLKSAFLSGNRLLDRSLRNLALALLNISTDSVGNISAFLLGDGLVGRLRNLVTDFFGDLPTHCFWRRRSSLDRRRVKLMRQIGNG